MLVLSCHRPKVAANRPVYLRVGYEFDSRRNMLEPEGYVKAYRHIVDLMHIKDVAFVWHSYAPPASTGYSIADWYPRDGYVDWVGLSVFGPDYKRGLDFAKTHKNPS